MSVAGTLCPVHHQLLVTHRDDFAACLQCEINRLREWLEGVRDFAGRTAQYASGQPHLALMSLKSAAIKALAGEAEADYKYRNSRKEVITGTENEPNAPH